MTRKDYMLLQTALGDALFRVRKQKNTRPSTPEETFWIISETIADYLLMSNKSFNVAQYKQHILDTAAVGSDMNGIERRGI